MHSYDQMKTTYSQKVCQTIDSPILVFDYFELSEMFVALGSLLLFGIIIYSWELMFLSLATTLIVLPWLRKRHNRGFFLHWPYRHLGMTLPGLVNPSGSKKYSD